MCNLIIFPPFQPCVIAECGEHKDGDSWGVAPSDGSGDAHPEFPDDSDIDFKDVSELCNGMKVYSRFRLENHFQ